MSKKRNKKDRSWKREDVSIEKYTEKFDGGGFIIKESKITKTDNGPSVFQRSSLWVS